MHVPPVRGAPLGLYEILGRARAPGMLQGSELTVVGVAEPTFHGTTVVYDVCASIQTQALRVQ
jgi:hypothetical protein